MRPTRRPSRPSTTPSPRYAPLLAALTLAARPHELNASALLGAGHPLVGALGALAALTRQALAVMGVLAACAVAAVLGSSWASAAAVGAAALLVGLVALAAGLLCEVRRRALDLIVEGRERLPLAAVERQRRRLLKPRTRARLATELADVLAEALTPRAVPVAGASLLAHPEVIRENSDELCAVAALMRVKPGSAGGVALVERLLRDGGSPLYGEEIWPLREELSRARYLLQWRVGAAEG